MERGGGARRIAVRSAARALPSDTRGARCSAAPTQARGRVRASADRVRVSEHRRGRILWSASGPRERARAAAAVSRAAGGDALRLLLSDVEAARSGAELVCARDGGAEPADAGARRDGAA